MKSLAFRQSCDTHILSSQWIHMIVIIDIRHPRLFSGEKNGCDKMKINEEIYLPEKTNQPKQNQTKHWLMLFHLTTKSNWINTIWMNATTTSTNERSHIYSIESVQIKICTSHVNNAIPIKNTHRMNRINVGYAKLIHQLLANNGFFPSFFRSRQEFHSLPF